MSTSFAYSAADDFKLISEQCIDNAHLYAFAKSYNFTIFKFYQMNFITITLNAFCILNEMLRPKLVSV